MTAHSKGSGGQRAASAALPAGASLLEHSQNVVTEGGKARRRFELVKCGCDCWYCEPCARRKGYNLRARLIPVLETFRGLMMLTLTIDPTLFESPRNAYLHVREERGISRLMRSLHDRGHLHSRRYFYVVEFQKHTEQAHFHVLIDASRVPKQEIDELWGRLRPPHCGEPQPDRPAFGMTRFSVTRFEGGHEHAGRYVTKYLTKRPSHGYPSWVLDMGEDKRVPRFQTSRPFWPDASPPSTPTGKTRESNPRTYRQRLRDCGTMTNLFEHTERINPQTGEVTRETNWRARLVAGGEAVECLHAAGRFHSRVEITADSPLGAITIVEQLSGIPVRIVSGLTAERRAS